MALNEETPAVSGEPFVRRGSRALMGIKTGIGWVERARKTGVPIVPTLIVVSVLFVAVFANFQSPHDPTKNSLPDRRLPPAWVEGGSTEYLLGTDSLGRDVLSRLMHGARIAVTKLMILYESMPFKIASSKYFN